MKKIILVAVFIFVAGVCGIYAQQVTIYPIPSYNTPLTSLNTGFQENTHMIPGHEKRDMEIEITASTTWNYAVYGKVWLVKGDGEYVKGPYIVYLNQLLSVPIDNDQWGVIIRSNWAVNASVWID